MQRYLLVEPNLHSFGVLEEPKLELFTERHHFRLPALPMSAVTSIAREIGAHNEAGVIFSLTTGLPGRRHLKLAGHSLRRSRRAFFHWPYEEAIEVIDRERFGSLWRHWAAYNAAVRLSQVRARLRQVSVIRALRGWHYARNQGRKFKDDVGFLSVDFGNTRTHLVAGIEWMRSLGKSIENVQSSCRVFGTQSRRAVPQRHFPKSSQAAGVRSTERWVEFVTTLLRCEAWWTAYTPISMEEGLVSIGLGTLLEALRRSEPRAIPPDMETSSSTGAADSLPAVRNYRASLSNFRGRFRPLPFLNSGRVPTPEAPLPGTGVAHSYGLLGATCFRRKLQPHLLRRPGTCARDGELHLPYRRVVIPCSTRWGSRKK